MDESATISAYVSIRDHVISKIRSELVSNGELKLSVLNEIHATWQRKMIQAGVISGGTLETSGSKPVTHAHAPQDPNPASGIDIDALFPSTELEMFIKKEGEGFYIPQMDGSGDVDDVDIKPNIEFTTCKFGSGDGDDVDIKPNIKFTTNDEDDEELNENDDVEECGIDDDAIPNLIVCQFDHVKKKKCKNIWESKLKAGVMNINGKEILFSQAKGDFEF